MSISERVTFGPIDAVPNSLRIGTGTLADGVRIYFVRDGESVTIEVALARKGAIRTDMMVVPFKMLAEQMLALAK